MRNTPTIYPSDSVNPMTVNAINIETNPMTAITASNHHHECQPLGLPVATKSQPKPKSRSIESQSRATKRPPSERRFKCDQCERMFFTRKDVKRHLVVHTGIRNFACPFCTQRFGRKDHLVRHAKKSHNRDTRSSTVKNSSVAAQTDKGGSNGVPTLIEAKSNGISSVPTVSVGQQMTNQSKQSFNYQNNCQNGDQSSLVLLTNGSNNTVNAINNSHTDPNANAHCGPYAHHHNQTPNHTNHHVMIAGMHANESLCQYMSGHGMHTFEDMISPNAIKSETPPITAHHYFAFPVNSTGLTYPLPNGPFLPNCLVTNAGPGGLNSCASSASVAAFGIPVSNVANASNPFSVDVNPSLPHFNQAFQ